MQRCGRLKVVGYRYAVLRGWREVVIVHVVGVWENRILAGRLGMWGVVCHYMTDCCVAVARFGDIGIAANGRRRRHDGLSRTHHPGRRARCGPGAAGGRLLAA
jgi:hypothetical protein